MPSRFLIIALLLLFSVTVSAQNVKTVEGEYVYHAPGYVTLEEAKQIALERAQAQAIAEKFGTLVQQTNTTRMENTNGQSSSDFFSVGSSEVKGEWLQTIGEPTYDITYVDGMLVVTCRVKGKAAEISSAAVDFQSKVLRNGIEDRYESDHFRNGDDLYLSFQTPVDGYVAVYLVDDKLAYCLLPYRNQTTGIYPVKANKRYLFFNTKDALPEERAVVDEYVMTCERPTEHNLIYVIFSPNQFFKATDAESQRTVSGPGLDGLPRELTYDDLQRWLVKCRKHDHEMSMDKVVITIEK